MPRYYELEDDMLQPGRWHLRHPVDEHGVKINPWQFTQGRGLESRGLIRFPVRPDGVTLEFTQDAFATPVVHERVVRSLERLVLQEVQFLPVQVENHSGPYFILNTLRTIRCIDDARCEEVEYWRPEDGQPEKVGQYQSIAGLRIDPTKVEGAHIFRPWGWRMALLVSEDVKEALEHEGVTGTRFTEV
ncbi:imm11 family protein [Archangium sp.]|uniref:imm11 family protein n=1 Tax=Archangium sp. TaxID=1872627 RepID=UPI00286B68F0|nr:DUF1629 domain-containing protein [Archangium sp.]